MQARSRFYLRFIVWRRRAEYPKVMSFLVGSGGVPPRKFFKINMRWDTICCILRDNFKKCYSGILFSNNTPCSLSYSVLRQGILTSCALTSSRLDDFFQYSYLYPVMITIFLGEAGYFWGGGSFYPSNTLDWTLQKRLKSRKIDHERYPSLRPTLTTDKHSKSLHGISTYPQ